MKQITLEAAISMAVTCPSVSFSFVGSPGVGKTFKTAARLRAAGYTADVISCQNMVAEDMAQLPRVNDDGTVSFLPNRMWAPVPGQKRAFILDEAGKAHEDVFNALLGLLYGKPRTMQGFAYPADTIVIVTSNPTVFGAGDNIKPHHVNRMVNLEIADPATDEAQKDMLDLSFDPRMIMWAAQTPAALCSYDPSVQKKPEGELSPYFGYLERRPKQPFCSMRSMEIASELLKGNLPPSALYAALSGCIGPLAAGSLTAFLEDSTGMVPLDHMLNTPATAKVPALIFDQRIAALTAAAALTPANWKPLFQYTKRLHPDVFRSVFLGAVQNRSSHPAMRAIPSYNREFITAFADEESDVEAVAA